MTKRWGTVLLCVALCATLSGCAVNKPSAYKKAVAAFASGDYEEAAEGFERAGDYEQAETYAAYARGLTYYERGEYIEAEPYFEKAQDFMYGKDRYAYCHAYVLETQGDFSGALAIYREMADRDEPYEEAAIHAAYCEARYAEANADYETALYRFEDAGDYTDAASRLDNLQKQVYAKAVELMDAGQYGSALSLFTMLGSYRESQSLARSCKDVFRKEDYEQAEALLAQGDLQGAYEAFKGLTGYNDAETRALEIGEQLGIEEEPAE